MSTIHLWPLQTEIQAGEATTGYRMDFPNTDGLQITYILPEENASMISGSCDAFVVEALFPAMRYQKDLLVHGQVSPSLIKNLEEYQSVWHSWKPDKYQKIEIIADDERERLPASTDAIMTFSGGVDSCFTAWRHANGLAGRWNQTLKFGIMIHGFDIPLRYPATFKRAAERARVLLDSIGINLITVKHNTKALGIKSEDNHATVLASCLMLLQDQFSIGLIPNSISYHNLLENGQLPFGSNPLTDPLLSSGSFSIIPDGTVQTRFDKIIAISSWPAAMENLRVCLSREGKIRDLNCCRCEKCVRNILAFRVLGLKRPPCFERDVSILRILSLRYGYPVFGTYHDLIGRQSKRKHTSGLWLAALKINFRMNRTRFLVKKFLGRGVKERG